MAAVLLRSLITAQLRTKLRQRIPALGMVPVREKSKPAKKQKKTKKDMRK